VSIDLLSQIDAYVSDIDVDQGAVTVDDVAELLDKVREVVSPPVRSSSRRGVAVAAWAAVATLIVIGTVAWLVPLDGGSPPADEPVVTTTLAAPPQPQSPLVAVTWEERPIEGPSVDTIVSTSFGYFGTDDPGVLWRSSDGTTWEPALTDLREVSVVSDGAIALVAGLRDRRPVLLRSADGVEWSEIDRSLVPDMGDQYVAATTPSGLTLIGHRGGEHKVVAIDTDRVTAVYEPPWNQEACCAPESLVQVGDNIVAYQDDHNSPQFSHAWEYRGNGQWSDPINIDVRWTLDHAVVGDTMLSLGQADPKCCRSQPEPGEAAWDEPDPWEETVWPVLSSDDGINWTEIGEISGHNVSSLHLNAGSSFWVYGPPDRGGPSIVVGPGTTLGISVDGQHWQEFIVPAAILKPFPNSGGSVHVAGNKIFVLQVTDDGVIQSWVATVETN
jgi:hypothetical protein